MNRRFLLLVALSLPAAACASPAPPTSFGAGAVVPGAVRIADVTTIPASLRAGTVGYVRVARRLDPLPGGTDAPRALPTSTSAAATAAPSPELQTRFRPEAPTARVEVPAPPVATAPEPALRTEPAELRPMTVPTGARASVPAPTTMPTTPSIVVSGRRPVAPKPPAVRTPTVATNVAAAASVAAKAAAPRVAPPKVAVEPAPSAAELEAAAAAARKQAQVELERGGSGLSRLRRRAAGTEVEAPPRPGSPLPAPRPVRPLDLTEFEQRTRKAD